MIKPNGSRVKDRIDSTYLARPFWMTPNTLVFVYVPAQRGDRATVARAREPQAHAQREFNGLGNLPG